MTIASLVVSCLALGTSLFVAWGNIRYRRRQASAALAPDLYAALRSARDAAFEVGKPLGGGQQDQLINFRSAVIDLADLRPTIRDGKLRDLVDKIFDHEAIGLVNMIDPKRFVGMFVADKTYQSFLVCGRDCASAIERCQEIRRGVG